MDTIMMRRLIALFLLQVWLVQVVTGNCQLRPWSEILRSNDDHVFDLQCQRGQYLECEDEHVFKSPLPYRANLTLSCGVRLECPEGISISGIIAHSKFSAYVPAGNFMVEISSCSLQSLNLGTGLVRARSLYVSLPNNNLSQTTATEFNLYAPLLHGLALTRNSISSWNLPTGYSQLRVIDLSWNVIQTLRAGFLTSFPHLHLVNLSHNEIKSLPALGIRTTVTREVTILFNNNQISDIADMAFNGLQIETLDLSSNQLTGLAKEIDGVRFIRSICIQNNQITGIKSEAFVKTSVERLDLSGNKLPGVQDNVFSYLTALKALLLSRNNLSFITRVPFEGDLSLEYLDLSGNRLTNILSDTFTELPNLKTLLLNANLINAFDANSFSGLALELLDVSNNPLQAIPPETFLNTSVSQLDLSTCHFEEFPYDTSRHLNGDLKTLNLSNNFIQSFPSVGLGKAFPLVILDLSNNRLNVVPCSWIGDSLSYLYLHSNNISYVENCLFTERMMTLIQFTLARNPLDCCMLQWLINTSPALDNILDATEMTCRMPSGSLQGINVPVESSACKSNSLDEENNLESAEESGFGVDTLLGAIFGTFFGLLFLQAIIGLIIWGVRKSRPSVKTADANPRKTSLPTTPPPRRQLSPPADESTLQTYESVDPTSREDGQHYEECYEGIEVPKTSKVSPTQRQPVDGGMQMYENRGRENDYYYN